MRKIISALFLSLALIAGPFSHSTKVFASTAGPNSPGTLADDSAVGTDAWSNPGNASANDASYANCGAMFGTQSHYLKATNFSFSFSGTVNGVRVEVGNLYTPNTVSPGPSWTVVKLVKGGTVSGNNKGTGTMPATENYIGFGSSSDLWGLTLSATDITASNFGVVISVTDTTFTGTMAKINHIRITITYTVAASGMPPRRVIMTRSAGAYSVVPNPNQLQITRRTYEETDGATIISARALTLHELLELDYLRPRKTRYSNNSLIGCC